MWFSYFIHPVQFGKELIATCGLPQNIILHCTVVYQKSNNHNRPDIQSEEVGIALSKNCGFSHDYVKCVKGKCLIAFCALVTNYSNFPVILPSKDSFPSDAFFWQII